MRIVPFSIPNIDYDALLGGGSELAGRALGRGIDRSRGVLADSVIVLADIERSGQRAFEALKGANQALYHLHFGFLIDAPFETILDVMTDRRIVVTKGKPWVASGPLISWKGLIDRHLTLTSDLDARRLFNAVYVFFERVGLGEIWGRHKKMLDDSTFILE